MKIALVFPPFYFEPMYNMPPLGLINLATRLKNTPHQVRIFDFPLAIRQKALHPGQSIYDDCATQILEFNPDVAGFSVQCTTYPPAVQIARRLKKLKSGIRVVFGGHNASFVDERTLARFPFVDAIVRGEGEITFPELLLGFEGQRDLREIEGITCRIGGRIFRNPDRPLIENLDSLPLSDYSLVPPLALYRDLCGISRSIAILEVGRGCPHHCIYCSQSLVWRRRARTFSVGRLISEAKNLVENFGAECFLLAFDQFTAKRSFAEEFCAKMIETGLNRIPWYCISRLDTVDEALLRLMREAGCESMCYGIDSGSEKTLAFIRKNIERDVLLQRVRETTGQEIVPTLSFVIGFPEERKEDLEETLQLALKCAVAGSANILVQMATILPGTDLYNSYSQLLVREVDTYFSLGIEFDGGGRLASDEALIDSDPALFSSFYNLPCPAAPLRDLNDIASWFSIVASLYPRSFLLLALELGLPVSEVFSRFLDFLAERTGERKITPQSCFAHFDSFAADLLAGKTHPVRDYIPEMVRYETCLIKAGGQQLDFSPFRIDLNRTVELRPVVNEKISIEEFTFSIPIIIFEAGSGHFVDSCPRERVHLVFRKLHGKIDVREINEFGVDFLRLCDGRRDLDSIAKDLYPAYGKGADRAEFARQCSEAARVLADLQLILPAGPLNPDGKGGETDAPGKGGRENNSDHCP